MAYVIQNKETVVSVQDAFPGIFFVTDTYFFGDGANVKRTSYDWTFTDVLPPTSGEIMARDQGAITAANT
jgi:hypothetical protein